jgi:hypothetical protein
MSQKLARAGASGTDCCLRYQVTIVAARSWSCSSDDDLARSPILLCPGVPILSVHCSNPTRRGQMNRESLNLCELPIDLEFEAQKQRTLQTSERHLLTC